MYLSKEQIKYWVEKMGQPEASVKIARFFNQYRSHLDSADVADLYDEDYTSMVANHPAALFVDDKYKITISNLYTFNYLRKILKPNQRIIDIGCGQGDFALAVASAFGSVVYGIDFHCPSIEAANRKLEGTTLACHFICGDIGALETTALVDFAIFNDVTEHLSDRELKVVFNKVKGILSEEGQLLIHTPNGY
jgi:2-polyprenyl-3-methyl-5-hydroxy-6-metoxy-1,4-benzoquinol methylase